MYVYVNVFFFIFSYITVFLLVFLKTMCDCHSGIKGILMID